MSVPVLHHKVISKAQMAVQDLTTGAGYLQPIPAKEFLKLNIAETTMMRMARIHPMQAPEEHIDKFRYATRALRAGSSGVSLSALEMANPQLSKQVLNAHLVKAQVDIPLEVLEDNIEKAGFLKTILDGLAPRVGLDWEELCVNGDTDNSVDPFLALFDGWMKQASAITYNHLGGAVSINLWNKLIKLMPTEFQRMLSQAALFTSWNLQHDWRANLAGRIGAVGDAHLQSLDSVKAFGIPLVPCANIRDDNTYDGLSNYSDVLLTHPKNLIVGLYSGIRVFLDLSIKDGIWSIVIRFRTDAKLIEDTAVVKGRNVLSGATSLRVGGSSTAELIPDDPTALSELGFSVTDTTVGYDDGVTSYVPPTDLGITAPSLFTP